MEKVLIISPSEGTETSAVEAETATLFGEEQAGEVADGTWAAQRAEIKPRFPK